MIAVIDVIATSSVRRRSISSRWPFCRLDSFGLINNGGNPTKYHGKKNPVKNPVKAENRPEKTQ